jgi:hypothetical protein
MEALFAASLRRAGIGEERSHLSTDAFRRSAPGGQMGVFDRPENQQRKQRG